MRRNGSVPISVLGLVFLMLILPVALFLIGQQTYLPNRAAEQAENLPVPTRVGALVDDAYVDADVPTKNLGEEAVLWADGSSVKISYLKFDLSGKTASSIRSAVLRLKVTHASEGAQTIYAVADSSWTEKAITYGNRPSLGQALGKIQGTKVGEKVEIDLTPYAKSKAGGMMSVALGSSDPGGLAVGSKEAVIGGAELVME
ncbi:hypothetical protein A2721_00140 [Candidatus Gottesmanbacteria bacterium RIFCSPHIGHO2_01_FULL_47_48]|uniref:Carbohydrate-binding module family 96 domain-containing protein n=1 Tax=Candidatus Gottesmanbacteria bacterium RIFCSPHIGHO2_01_FULL_47_48 TaxID=1798381 RepID=A0A1F6A3E0_9BACT|nr:MAG: hypothetical protein A2721_00140 [Candidatus Gottesmanbacteria bacterium RIFCSPHIGHO2_01_FULL_47_48]